MKTAPLRYYKRFQMELDLRRWQRPDWSLPANYRLVPWHPLLVDVHARVKCRSFRDELDSVIFPCLGQFETCVRLMDDIADRDGFVPEATWLVEFLGSSVRHPEFCGTIQAIRVSRQRANIQNVGVTPRHRGLGLGAALVQASLWGMQQVGSTKAALEVTADNHSAVRLYRRLGFRAFKTVYKSVEPPEQQAVSAF